MATSPPTAGSTSDPPSPATRVPPDRSMPTRVVAEGSRRGGAEGRSGSSPLRHDGGARSVDGDAANGPAPGRSRGWRNDESVRGAHQSDDEGGHDDSKADPDSARRGPMASDEFALISVPLDTWVGRYVRITTPRHNGTTGLVHRTGNGWVNLQTSLGDVAKRAYDLIVIPKERANIDFGGGASADKGDGSRGKRYRGSKGASTSIGSNSGSGDDRKAANARNRASRAQASTAHSTSDSSDQDDNDDDGEEHDHGRSTRRRGRTPIEEASDFDEADQREDDDEHGDNDDEPFDERMRGSSRGDNRPFPSSKARSMSKAGSRDKGERYVAGEPMKSSGRMSITYTRREGASKSRGSGGEQDKSRDRDRTRDRGDAIKGSSARDRDAMKEGFASMSRGKDRDRDGDAGGSRVKRRDIGNSFAVLGDLDDKQSGSSGRERVDRSKDKNGGSAAGKKDEAMIKSSWAAQMQKAKERPNLVHWRDELVAITKDSSEDLEDATLSVELMRARCDVCYHEKSDGDKFCWNADCWMSPVYSGYFKSDMDEDAKPETSAPSAPPRTGYINTFGRETTIDSALTSALQAPVKWLETKRKRKLEAHEVFSEDPALYRWQCWASNFPDPNSKDPTFVEDLRCRPPDLKRGRGASTNYARDTLASWQSPESRRFSAFDILTEDERLARYGMGGKKNLNVHGGGLEAMDVTSFRAMGGGSMMDGPPMPHKANRAGDMDHRGRPYLHEDGRGMEGEIDGRDAVRDGGGERHGGPRSGRLWA